MRNKSKSGAIVLGSKGVNATGLIRSLGISGIAVTFASKYSKIESKYTTDYLHLSEDDSKWLETLVEYGKKGKQRCAIFSSDDEAALWLDKNYEVLQKYFIVPNAKGKLSYIADKSVMNQLAKKAGLNVPAFSKISLEKYNGKVEYPVILKPYAGYAGSKGDILICKNELEFTKAVKKLIELGYTEVMLQQFLDDLNQEEIGLMGMVLSNGKVVIPGIIHKIRSYPTGRGSTSYARFSPNLSDIDLKKIEDFVSATGYVGLFDIEMMNSNGKYWFIEINFRNGQYGYTPTAAGYNLPGNWCRGMKGEEIDTLDKIKELYYINERDDFQHVKQGKIALKDWMGEFRGARAYGMFCPGDQRPFIRQYVKIPDRVVIKWNRVKNLLKDLLIKEEWNIAIRSRKDCIPLWKEGGVKEPFKVLRNTVRYWAADPFIIEEKGKDYLFFEMFDRFLGKGVIGCREISDGKIGKMKIVYKADKHLSFPFVFKYNNEFYMLPEYSEGKCLPLLKAIKFPDKWEVICSWMERKRVVDTALVEYNSNNYLFTQELKDGYSAGTLDIYTREKNNWEKHEKSPVINSYSNSRLGGKVFKYGENLIRVSQDCKTEYGKKLHFNLISNLSKREYEESMIGTVDINQIKVETRKRFIGIHTYNFNEGYEVIDLKNESKIKLGNILNIIYRIFCKSNLR